MPLGTHRLLPNQDLNAKVMIRRIPAFSLLLGQLFPSSPSLDGLLHGYLVYLGTGAEARRSDLFRSWCISHENRRSILVSYVLRFSRPRMAFASAKPPVDTPICRCIYPQIQLNRNSTLPDSGGEDSSHSVDASLCPCHAVWCHMVVDEWNINAGVDGRFRPVPCCAVGPPVACVACVAWPGVHVRMEPEVRSPRVRVSIPVISPVMLVIPVIPVALDVPPQLACISPRGRR